MDKSQGTFYTGDIHLTMYCMCIYVFIFEMLLEKDLQILYNLVIAVYQRPTHVSLSVTPSLKSIKNLFT